MLTTTKKNVLEYKGYVATFGYDDSADAFHGRLVGIRDVVDFYGRDVEGLKAEMRESVEEYLAFCAERGVEPEKAWSGKMTIRPDDEQHRRFVAAAAIRGLSVNQWMIEVLDKESLQIIAEAPRAG